MFEKIREILPLDIFTRLRDETKDIQRQNNDASAWARKRATAIAQSRKPTEHKKRHRVRRVLVPKKSTMRTEP